MTSPQASDHHDDDVDRWLSQHQRALTSLLGSMLDSNAGLREVLLQSRHDSLVNSLGPVLDTEAGLAAILPSPPLTSDQSATGERNSAQTTAELLQSVHAHTRMTLRADPHVGEAYFTLNLARALNRDLTRDRALELARALDLSRANALTTALEYIRPQELTAALEHARMLSLSLSSDLDRDLVHITVTASGLIRNSSKASALADALDHAHTKASTSALGINGLTSACHDAIELANTLERAGSLARALAHALDIARMSDLIRHARHSHAHTLASNIVTISVTETRRAIGTLLGQAPPITESSAEAFLNDFTTSDLRNANLAESDLSGIRWSEIGTLWPPMVNLADLKSRSEEIPTRSGVYVVRPGATTARDLAQLT
ncbi:hypothetical protein [Streptomyces mayteni]